MYPALTTVREYLAFILSIEQKGALDQRNDVENSPRIYNAEAYDGVHGYDPIELANAGNKADYDLVWSKQIQPCLWKVLYIH